MITLAPPKDEWEELEEIELWPDGEEGYGVGKRGTSLARPEIAPFLCLL